MNLIIVIVVGGWRDLEWDNTLMLSSVKELAILTS